MQHFELIIVIVNFGQGTKVLKIAKHNGVRGGTVFLGMGTMKNRLLEFLELAEVRKEIVLMAAESSAVDAAIKSIDKEFDFKKPYHGIAFTMPLPVFIGGAGNLDYIYNKRGGENGAMYNMITVIVDKGMAEIVMESATGAGARGGTVIKARGAGHYETGKLFHMDIEPEKEMVMIISEEADTERIAVAIRDRLKLGNGGTGIVICQEVTKTYGIS